MHFMKYFLLTQRNKGNLQIRSCQLFIYYLEIYAKIVVKMPSVFFFLLWKFSYFRNVSSFLSSCPDFWDGFFQKFFCNNWENYHPFLVFEKWGNRDNYCFLSVRHLLFCRLELVQHKSDSIFSLDPVNTRNITYTAESWNVSMVKFSTDLRYLI